MKVFRRILHATDFSTASRPALAKAIALARQNRTPLLIAYVLVPLGVIRVGDGFVSPGTYDEDRAHGSREHAHKQLIALIQRVKKAGGHMRRLSCWLALHTSRSYVQRNAIALTSSSSGRMAAPGSRGSSSGASPNG